MSKKISKEVKKGFALTAICAAAIAALDEPTLKAKTLKLQFEKVKKVFRVKAGAKNYYTVSDEVGKIFKSVADKHSNHLHEEEVEVFVEMILSLMPKAKMKEYLGFSFSTKQKVRDCEKSGLISTVLGIDKNLNEAFETTTTATRDSIAKVMVKPVKVKTTKARDVAKPRHLKRIRNRAKYARSKL